MAHLVGKDIYQRLAKKIDGLTARTPYNQTFHKILTELYSEKDANVVVQMPYGLAPLKKILRTTKMSEKELLTSLDRLSSRGLVLDLMLGGKTHYMPSPLVVGIFEFSMMRTGQGVHHKKCAELFHEYMMDSDVFFDANLGKGQKTAIARALPHKGSVLDEDYVEVLDFEKANHLVGEAKRFSVGLCSCRHVKQHMGDKKCAVPLRSCTSFGKAADYLIRHKLAEEISKQDMLALMVESKEMGLVFNADNVKRNISFICHCCGCCCHMLQGISKFGYANTVVSSRFIANLDEKKCKGCHKCVRACPINAIQKPVQSQRPEKHEGHVAQGGAPNIDHEFCLGCGVCALKCPTQALRLVSRKQKIFYPENTFERVILTCLEQGTLQNQLFDDPTKITHSFMRFFVGGFLRLPPIKRALVSDVFRSRFLSMIKSGARAQKKGDVIAV